MSAPDGETAAHRPRRHIGRRALLAGGIGLGGAGLMARAAAQRPGVSQGQPPPAGTESAPTQALQRRVYGTMPLLAGAPVNELEGIITPNRVHFVRNHFNVPQIDAATWTLTVTGAVRTPRTFTLEELKALPSRSLICYIECSGNSRGFFRPQASGTQWGNDAISVAEWTGVPLRDLLELVGLSERAVDIVAEGADAGRVYRAIPREKALDPDTLVAYLQNGEALTRENGYPVRLVVPGWGGISSIKWLVRLEAHETPFLGYYNNRTYVYETPGLPKRPVQALGVKSFIARPADGSTVPAGRPLVVQGYAWSGWAQVTRVEVSVNGGPWQEAQLLDPVLRWAWVRWRLELPAPAAGTLALRSRATDAGGNVQPETVAWNRYGYGNNAIQTVTVQVS